MHSESKRYDFERLYIDCQPRLTAYALRFVNNPIEAQDLVHDCFMALWDRQAPLDPEEARMLLVRHDPQPMPQLPEAQKHRRPIHDQLPGPGENRGGASLQLRFLLRRKRASLPVPGVGTADTAHHGLAARTLPRSVFAQPVPGVEEPGNSRTAPHLPAYGRAAPSSAPCASSPKPSNANNPFTCKY